MSQVILLYWYYCEFCYVV